MRRQTAGRSRPRNVLLDHFFLQSRPSDEQLRFASGNDRDIPEITETDGFQIDESIFPFLGIESVPSLSADSSGGKMRDTNASGLILKGSLSLILQILLLL